MIICTLCSQQSNDPIPGENAIKRLANFHPTKSLVWPVCNRCLGRLRNSDVPHWDKPIEELQKKAANAISTDRYSDFADAMQSIESQVVILDVEMRAAIITVERLAASKKYAEQAKASLLKAVKLSKNISYFFRRLEANRAIADMELRVKIFTRDGCKCVNCSAEANLTIDHIKPVLLGGGDEPENLQTLCKRCNSSKGSKYRQ